MDTTHYFGEVKKYLRASSSLTSEFKCSRNKRFSLLTRGPFTG